MVPEINEFKLSSHPWRISWLGELRYPPPWSDEVRIVVHLSELKDDFSDPLSNGSLAKPERHEAIHIKFGLISLLKIGSVWINGRHDVSRSSRKASLDVDLDQSQLRLIRFNEPIRIDGQSHQALSSFRYQVGRDVASAIRTSWLAVAYNPKPNLAVLLIPSSVLFQKCFATSPNAIRRLAWGELGKIIDLDSCGYTSDEPSTFYVNLWKNIRDNEAPVIANLIADPVARREYSQFRSALISASVNDDQGTRPRERSAQIKLSLPFSNRASIVAIGKRLPFRQKCSQDNPPTKWGFLITEIRSLDVKFAFDRLAIDRKNKNLQGQNRDDEDLEECWVHTTTASLPPDLHLPITSRGEPSNKLDQIAIEEAGGIHDPSLIVIDRQTDVQKYRSGRLFPEVGAKSSGSATAGDPKDCDGGLAPLDVIATQPPKPPRTLDHFLEVLESMAEQGHLNETLRVAPSWVSSERFPVHVINFLSQKIKGVRSWHLMGGRSVRVSAFRPRGYVVAQVIHAGCVSYLIELERKNNEAFSTACLQNQTGTSIGSDEIAGFMIRVAKENGWGAAAAYSHWKFVWISHSKGNQVTHQARAIIQRLTR